MTNKGAYHTNYHESITIDVDYEGVTGKEYWEVSCWDANDENRWTKTFRSREEAQAEYDRWRP